MMHGDIGSQGNSIAEPPLAHMPDMETVVTAINTVLCGDPTVDKKPATKWLESLRNSIFAWKVCDELLIANQSTECSYMAANMLKHKIDRQFNELPLDCYNSLKDSILNQIQTIQDPAVQGQLAEALVKLTILLSQWVNPIEDLAQKLNLMHSLVEARQNQDTLIRALTNRYIFADILEQVSQDTISSSGCVRIGANRREEFEEYLMTKCSQVIDWWLSTLKESIELKQDLNNSMASEAALCDTDLKKNILKNINLIDKLVGKIYQCFCSWTKLMSTQEIDKCISLVDAAFTDLRDVNCSEQLHDCAVETVVTLSELCEETTRHKHIVDYLISKVFTLEEAYLKSVANEENAKSSNYTKIFTDVAETACPSLVSGNNLMNNNFKLVELLLKCLEHYDFEVVEVTFGFWWRFVEEIQNSHPSSNAKNPQHEDAINKSIMALIKLCQCDPDSESVITSDLDLDGFRCRTMDLIKHALFLTNGSDFIRNNNVMNLLNPDLSKSAWEKTEAILFLMSCIIDTLSDKDKSIKRELLIIMLSSQTFTPNIMEFLENKRQLTLKIGTNTDEVHPQIINTTSKILGQLHDHFQEDPTFLELSIKYLLSAISNPTYRTQLARNSASSLAKIIQSNAARHLTNSPGLISILTDLCANLDHLGDETAATESLRCCAAISQSIIDYNIKDQFLCQIVRPNLAALLNTLNLQLSGNMKDDEELPSKYLDRLANLFRELNLTHTDIPSVYPNLISLIENELWPTLLKTLQKYASENGYAIERSCRTIRYILRSVKPMWMAQRVAETMVNLYQSYPQNSSPLYVGSILVDEFANKSPDVNTVLFKMLDAFCALTFTLLKMEGTSAQSLLSMKNYPETIDDMMRLFNRFIEKCPLEFVACQAIQSIIELSISSIRLDHRDANQTVVKFLIYFIELGLPEKELPQIRDAIKSYLGARLVDAVIKACLFDLPTHFIADEADILYLLLQYDRHLFISWVEATVSTLPSTNIQGIVSVTNEQFDDFKKTMSSAKSAKQIVAGVRFLARLYQ